MANNDSTISCKDLGKVNSSVTPATLGGSGGDTETLGCLITCLVEPEESAELGLGFLLLPSGRAMGVDFVEPVAVVAVAEVAAAAVSGSVDMVGRINN